MAGNVLQSPNGISSDEALHRAISALPPDEFEAGFRRWTAAASNNKDSVPSNVCCIIVAARYSVSYQASFRLPFTRHGNMGKMQ